MCRRHLFAISSSYEMEFAMSLLVRYLLYGISVSIIHHKDHSDKNLFLCLLFLLLLYSYVCVARETGYHSCDGGTKPPNSAIIICD